MKKKINSIFSDILLPFTGLLVVFFFLTALFGIQQVFTNYRCSWANYTSNVTTLFFKIIFFQFNSNVWLVIRETAWRTLNLVVFAVAVSLFVGILFTAFDMFNNNRIITLLIGFFEKLFASIPGFLLALVVWFSMRITLGNEWPQGEVGRGFKIESFFDLFRNVRLLASYIIRLIPPVMVLVLADGNLVYFIKTIRIRAKQVRDQYFLKYLRESGYSAAVILFKHIIPHSITEIVYLVKYRFVYLLCSAAVVELIFNRPGLSSRLVTSAIHGRGSFETVAGAVWLFSLVAFFLVIVADFIYKNSSKIIIRGYYPVASRLYYKLKSIKPVFSKILIGGFAIAVLSNIFILNAQGLLDDEIIKEDETITIEQIDNGINQHISLSSIDFKWKEMGKSFLITVILCIFSTFLAVLLGIVVGINGGLISGKIKFFVKNGIISSFDIVPKFFLVFASMTVLSSTPFFQGSTNQIRVACVYCIVFALFTWNELARAIINRIDEIHDSSSYISALAIGCSRKRLFFIYYLPVLKREIYAGFLTIALTVLFMESALSYCEAGIDHYTSDLQTIASFIKYNIHGVLFIPPYGKVLLKYLPSMISGGMLLTLILSVEYFSVRLTQKDVV